MSLVGIVARGTTLTSHHSLFFSPPHTHTKTQQTKKKNTQSIEWGDRFTASQGQGSSGWMLSWSGLFFLPSFLSLRCPLGSHPSPRIPLFCLFYINTISPGRRTHTHTHTHTYTFSFSLLVCPSHIHMYEYTRIHSSRTHGYKRELLTKCSRLVKRPPSCHRWDTHTHTHILTHYSLVKNVRKLFEKLDVWCRKHFDWMCGGDPTAKKTWRVSRLRHDLHTGYIKGALCSFGEEIAQKMYINIFLR